MRKITVGYVGRVAEAVIKEIRELKKLGLFGKHLEIFIAFDL